MSPAAYRKSEIADQIDWMGGNLHKRLDGIGHCLNQTGEEYLMRKAKGEVRSWYEYTLQTIARLDGLRREAIEDASPALNDPAGLTDPAKEAP